MKSCTFWIILDDVLVSNLLHPWDVWLCMLIPKTSFDTEEVPVKLLRYVEISFTTWVKHIFVLEHFEPLSTTYFMIFLKIIFQYELPQIYTSSSSSCGGHPIRLHFAIRAAASQATRNHHEYCFQALRIRWFPASDSLGVWRFTPWHLIAM